MRAVQIGIRDFTPQEFPERFFSSYYMYESECRHLYSDKLNIRVLNLSQIDNPENEKRWPELYRWAQLFKAGTWEEIEQMVADNKVNKDFVFTLKELSAEEKIRQQCEAREDYYRRQADAAKYNQSLGYEKGYDTRAAENEAKIAEKDQKINEQAELIAKLMKQMKESQ